MASNLGWLSLIKWVSAFSIIIIIIIILPFVRLLLLLILFLINEIIKSRRFSSVKLLRNKIAL